MKKIIQSILFICVLSNFFSLQADDRSDDDSSTFGKTIFNPRSPGLNKAQESSGIARFIEPCDSCTFEGFASLTAEFDISFNKNEIGKFLFFNDSSTMTTGTAEGAGIDVFAENFLLNDNYFGAITAQPHVKNFILDASFYASLAPIAQGLYCIAHIPICWTHWNIDFVQTISSIGTEISANALGNLTAEAAPFDSWIEAWNGQAIFGDVKQPMNYARVNGRQKKFCGADVELALGYCFWSDEQDYWSANFRAIIPTSNRPNATFFFEPCTGNFHHFEFGGGFICSTEIWNCGCDQSLHAFLNANVYHVFSSRQKRTFDLTNNGPGSRYLLFKTFNPDGTYAGEIVRGPNILTLDVNAKNFVHGDAVLMFDYTFGGLTWDIGYNLWGRTKDEITLKQTIPANTYGVAGTTGTGPGANDTASNTTISGDNNTPDPTPVYLTTSDINIASAAHPGCFSHGIFTYLGYTWECGITSPFLGAGTEVEFSGASNNAFRMWHVWVKTGLTF